MRLSDILNLFRDYLVLGIVLMVVTALVIAVGYFGIYKKLCKGKREIKLVRLFWWLMLIIYLFVVLSVTLFRTSVFQNGQIISFFYSYKEAWISASETAWRNIILNILMFVPLGFWLPLGKEKFRVFWKTYLVGFLFTVAIESLQLILSLGLFEVADLFNNTLGTMIGYGLYKVVESFVLLFKKEKVKVARMLAGQIPLVFAVCMFTGIFWAYQKQELGNLLIECVSPYPEEIFEIVTNEEYRADIVTAVVYQTNTLTVEETESFARNFFENLGTTLDESRNDIYEDTAFYWSEDGHCLTISYKGGTYYLKDFNILFPEEGEEEPQQVIDATEEEITQALAKYGIELPEGAIFSYTTETGYTFTVERIEWNGIMYDGQLSCDYYDNGEFSKISNSIKQFEVYKEFEICSEKEAYEQILEGNFTGRVNPGDKIELGEASLGYMLDTKGFYQPVYNFEVSVNGEELQIQIPAIRK